MTVEIAFTLGILAVAMLSGFMNNIGVAATAGELGLSPYPSVVGIAYAALLPVIFPV